VGLGRGLPRLVAAFLWLSWFLGSTNFLRQRRRDKSRLVAAGHGLSRLLDVSDVLRHRRWCDQVLLAVGNFDAAAVEMALGAIALDRAEGAGKAGAFVARGGVLDGQAVFVVAAGRDRSRLVVHTRRVALARRTSPRLSPESGGS